MVRHAYLQPNRDAMQDGLSFAESQRALVAHVERLKLYILAQEERMLNLESQLQQRNPAQNPYAKTNSLSIVICAAGCSRGTD